MFLALWKNALTSRTPNVISPSSVSDFRPIDPNSINFHCMQKILLPRLMPSVNSCTDAILSLVYGIVGTLLKSWSNKHLYTIFFLHFSSTFNTVLPNQLYSDLQHFIDDSWELHWLTDFLKSWTHQIKLQKGLCEKSAIDVSVPQEDPLSGLLFTISTDEIRSRLSSMPTTLPC